VTDFKHDTLGSATTVLSTELNSLANNTLSSASSAYDNSSGLYIFFGVELTVAAQGSARSAGAAIIIYYSQDLVGSSSQDLTVESPILTMFPLDAATTARKHSQSGLWLPPSAALKFAAYNTTGQALAASGNVVKLVPWYTQAV
jgi:hypothetical protein